MISVDYRVNAVTCEPVSAITDVQCIYCRAGVELAWKRVVKEIVLRKKKELRNWKVDGITVVVDMWYMYMCMEMYYLSSICVLCSYQCY